MQLRFLCSWTNLEELRLSRYFERNNLRESIVVQPVIQKKSQNSLDDFLQPVEAANLAGGNVAASFRHAPHSSLRVWGLDTDGSNKFCGVYDYLEGVDVVDKRRLWSDLKVSDHTITLKNITLFLCVVFHLPARVCQAIHKSL